MTEMDKYKRAGEHKLANVGIDIPRNYILSSEKTFCLCITSITNTTNYWFRFKIPCIVVSVSSKISTYYHGTCANIGTANDGKHQQR